MMDFGSIFWNVSLGITAATNTEARCIIAHVVHSDLFIGMVD